MIGTRHVLGGDRSRMFVPASLEPQRQEVSSSGVGSPNLLLIGAGARAEEFLVPLMPSLAAPIVYLDGDNPVLPTMSVGTLIVRNVARMAPPHQLQFLEWMNAQSGTARVIAISPRSLFRSVQREAFLEPLYYRLNTVLVELSPR